MDNCSSSGENLKNYKAKKNNKKQKKKKNKEKITHLLFLYKFIRTKCIQLNNVQVYINKYLIIIVKVIVNEK